MGGGVVDLAAAVMSRVHGIDMAWCRQWARTGQSRELGVESHARYMVQVNSARSRGVGLVELSREPIGICSPRRGRIDSPQGFASLRFIIEIMAAGVFCEAQLTPTTKTVTLVSGG